MTAPLSLDVNSDGTRAAFRFFHPKGNIIAADIVSALSGALAAAARATRELLTGRSTSATEWNAAGLLELVADGAVLGHEVERWAAEYLRVRSAASLRHAALAARAGTAARVRQLLPALEQLYLRDLMHTLDAPEGITAFLEKRAPRWTDR